MSAMNTSPWQDRANSRGGTHGRSIGRVALTALTACAMFALYCGYAMVVNPLVQSPAIERGENSLDKLPPPTPPRQGVQMAEQYLPSQPWAATAKFVLRTDEAFIYFEDWDPLDGEQAVRFTPFAMVWLPKGKGENEPPHTVVSQSAYIRFAKTFHVADPDPGRVIGGALEGEVEINGPDGLNIAGKNFIFSEDSMMVWCEGQVRFRHGPHRGTGVGMQVALVPDEVAKAKEKLAVKGFRSVLLRRNVAMDLKFDSKSSPLSRRGNNRIAAVTPGTPQQPATPEKDKQPTVVKVRSAGRFDFNVESNIATFRDDVRVYHPTAPDEYNSLQASLLTLFFQPAEDDKSVGKPADGAQVVSVDSSTADPTGATNPTTPAEEERFQSVSSKLEFHRMEAKGPQVTLRSEENDLTATMERLRYNAKTGQALLNSSSTVRVLQKENEMHAPEIELFQQDGGRVDNVWCRGAGWLTNTNKATGRVELAAQWRRELKKYPDPATKLDIIDLHEQVQVRQPDRQFGLAADFMRLLIEPQDSEQPQAADGENRLRLKRMLALQNVAIVSPDLHGQAKRLEAEFSPWPAGRAAISRHLPGSAPQHMQLHTEEWQSDVDRDLLLAQIEGTPNRSPLGPSTIARSAGVTAARTGRFVSPASPYRSNPLSNGVQTVSSENTPIRSPRRNPPIINLTPGSETLVPPAPTTNVTTTTQGNGSNKPQAGDPPDQPIELKADLIQVKVLQGPGRGKTHVSEARAFGDVTVQQKHEDGEEPLQIEGERLFVENRSKDDQLLKVFGSPAQVRDRGTYLEGKQIWLDRGTNDSAVVGAGLLQIPVKRSLDGAELSEPRLLDILWKDKMTFDGLNANFYGEVRTIFADDTPATATTKAIRNVGSLRCDEMQVTMTERISFAESGNRSRRRTAGGERAAGDRTSEIRQILCFDNVQLDSNKYEDTRVTEVRRAEFTQLEMTPATGETVATGAGWTTLWSRGRMNPAGLATGAVVKANAAVSQDKPEWQFTRVDFSGKMEGNTKTKVATFHENVRALSGPVKRPDNMIDVERMPADAGWIRSQSLRLTRHQPTDTRQPAYHEALATGNAKIEGNTGAQGIFHGRADEISFDQSKGLYVLRSQGSRQATIWRQTQIGGEESRADAQRMDFVPSRNQLKLHGTRGLNGIN